MSSRTSRSLSRMRVLEVAALPAHERDQHVLAERQLAVLGRGASRRATWPRVTRSPRVDDRRWLMQVPWFERTNFAARYASTLAVVVATTICSAVDASRPRRPARPRPPGRSRAPPALSMPVPTSGASGSSSGTAWRCMFEPISARLASSCSRNGISARRHRDDLLRRDVHVVDLLGARLRNCVAVAGLHALVDEVAVLVERARSPARREAALPRRPAGTSISSVTNGPDRRTRLAFWRLELGRRPRR